MVAGDDRLRLEPDEDVVRVIEGLDEPLRVPLILVRAQIAMQEPLCALSVEGQDACSSPHANVLDEPAFLSKSTIAKALRESRSMRAGKLSVSRFPMIQIASSSQRNQTGETREPASDAVAKYPNRGRDRNSSRSTLLERSRMILMAWFLCSARPAWMSP
jgi:hypothetical protein